MNQFFIAHQEILEKENEIIITKLMTDNEINLGENKTAGYFRVDGSKKQSITIKYYTHKRGIGVGMSGTGIAYLEKPPSKLYTSIKEMKEDPDSRDGFVGFGNLSNNWYYFLWVLN